MKGKKKTLSYMFGYLLEPFIESRWYIYIYPFFEKEFAKKENPRFHNDKKG